MEPTNNTKPQGFAKLSPAERHANAIEAGKKAVNRHRWTSETAAEAGRKGNVGKGRRPRRRFKEEL